MIGEYTGVVYYEEDEDESSDYITKMLTNKCERTRILPGISVDSAVRGSEMRYINSVWPGKTPPEVSANVQMRTLWCHSAPRVFVIALRDIACGEAIVLDYGPDYFEKRK
jgi:hypothetical protein